MLLLKMTKKSRMKVNLFQFHMTLLLLSKSIIGCLIHLLFRKMANEERSSIAVTFKDNATTNRHTATEIAFDWTFVLAELENPEDEILKIHLK